MANSLFGKVCLVTGASRGIGRGIALQLGEAGATVYITGRTLEPKTDGIRGSLSETAQEVEARGGKCIPVQCDHADDKQVEAVFEKISKEQKGRLDILVNNAYAAVNAIREHYKDTFWEMPASMWDTVNNVGLRGHYMAAWHAANMMVPAKRGLIINISSAGGMNYLFNTAYGIGKAACDRMAADCAHELRKHNIAFISLWPGAVRTENVLESLTSEIEHPMRMAFVNGETVEFAGIAVVHLAKDKNIMKKSGRILMTGDLADEYGFVDVDGRSPLHFRRIKSVLELKGHTWLAAITPSFVKAPFWVIALATSKF